MAKEMFSNRIDSDLTDALKVEALAERRSVANMLEWILRERYSGLAGRDQGAEGSGGRRDSAVRVAPLGGGSTESLSSPAFSSSRPASPVVSPVVHDVPMTQSQARGLASRNGKCGADVAFGTKCKLCGDVHR